MKRSACACMQVGSKELYYIFLYVVKPLHSVIVLQKLSGTPSDNTEYLKALTVNVIIVIQGLNVCASTTNVSVMCWRY